MHKKNPFIKKNNHWYIVYVQFIVYGALYRPQVSMKPSQKSATLAASAERIRKNRFLPQKVTRTKTKKKGGKKRNETFDDRINPTLPLFFIYPSAPPLRPPHPHRASTIFTKGYFAQICSHSPFCYQDELLMCLRVASQMCQVRRHSARLWKNALSQTDVLISDVFSPSSALTRRCNFKPESGLTSVKTLWGDGAKVDVAPLLKIMFTLEPSNINHSTLISPRLSRSLILPYLVLRKKYLTLYAISHWLALLCAPDTIKFEVLRPNSASAASPSLPCHWYG